MMRGQTPGVGSAMGVGSATGVGLATGVGSPAGVQIGESGVNGSGCPEDPGCPEGPSCPVGPEDVVFLGVGLGVSSVLFLLRWLFLAHSSKICISADQTASSPHWPFKHLLLLLLPPCFNTQWNHAHMANPKRASSVSVQKCADPKGFCFVLPTFQHSSTRYWSLACFQAAPCCADTSADGLRTTSHDDDTSMVGSVRSVVV